MSYPGLRYPNDNNYLIEVKNRGYFILVDKNANNISLVPGGQINQLLSINPNLLFVFGKNIAGTKQDIIDSLYLSGLEINDIDEIISSGISIANINSPESQQWIDIFQKQNSPMIVPKPVVISPVTVPKPVVTPPMPVPKPVVTHPVTIPKPVVISYSFLKSAPKAIICIKSDTFIFPVIKAS